MHRTRTRRCGRAVRRNRSSARAPWSGARGRRFRRALGATARGIAREFLVPVILELLDLVRRPALQHAELSASRAVFRRLGAPPPLPVMDFLNRKPPSAPAVQ
jgi:hypothetical protein